MMNDEPYLEPLIKLNKTTLVSVLYMHQYIFKIRWF